MKRSQKSPPIDSRGRVSPIRGGFHPRGLPRSVHAWFRSRRTFVGVVRDLFYLAFCFFPSFQVLHDEEVKSGTAGKDLTTPPFCTTHGGQLPLQCPFRGSRLPSVAGTDQGLLESSSWSTSDPEQPDAVHPQAIRHHKSVCHQQGDVSHTVDIDSLVLVMLFRLAVSGSTSIIPCRV